MPVTETNYYSNNWGWGYGYPYGMGGYYGWGNRWSMLGLGFGWGWNSWYNPGLEYGDGGLVGAILITDMVIIHLYGILIIGVEVTILVITVGEVIAGYWGRPANIKRSGASAIFRGNNTNNSSFNTEIEMVLEEIHLIKIL